ncbi:MAG: gamma-glutamyl-gamma-aminobutyrate hydrolase family protein [Bryobacteraceae bacterium]
MKKVTVTHGSKSRTEPYADALRSVGVEPVLLSELGPLADGLLLTGGTDVDPGLYGQDRGPQTQEPDRVRDAVESKLLREALASDVPVLAICRGMQLLNVVRGGTLIQHLEGHRRVEGKESDPVHEVEIEPGTRLHRIMGTDRCAVNSRHHQAIERLGSGLTVSARSGDVVEGLEASERFFAVAVQWHPEDMIAVHELQKKLFEAFAQAVNTWARTDRPYRSREESRPSYS